jgi:hypothetical protein
MVFLNLNNADSYVKNCDNCMVILCKNDMITSKVRLALTKLTDSELADLIYKLNMISNQGIVSINSRMSTYSTVNAVDLDILQFCSAEKIYLLAYLASKGYFNLVLMDNVMSFEVKQYKKFLRNFKDSNIAIVVDYNGYEDVLEGWLDD